MHCLGDGAVSVLIAPAARLHKCGRSKNTQEAAALNLRLCERGSLVSARSKNDSVRESVYVRV